jgi:DNA invertase Pin-like site-specific DNA recombinase
VLTVQSGEIDLSTSSGRMVARMPGSAARYESEHKAERQGRKALVSRRGGGVWNGVHGVREALQAVADRDAHVLDAAVLQLS